MARALYTKVESGQRLVATDITNLTFFPIGTILQFSGSAYSGLTSARTEDNKVIWTLCNGTSVNGIDVPNLVDKFTRGGTASGTEYINPTTTNTQTISVPVPEHKHSITDTGHAHTVSNVNTVSSGHNSSGGATPTSKIPGTISTSKDTTGITQTNYAGTANASITVNIMPSYYTVIYIMKVA
jgi:hypothetical protein